MATAETLGGGGSQGKKEDVVLQIEDLKVDFHTYAGTVKALDGVEITLQRGETVGLVGESGCGKSVTAATIEGLLPDNAEVVSGKILLNGQDLLKKGKKEMREVRVKSVAMVFQDPMTFLNPVLSIGTQVKEVFRLDEGRVENEAIRLLEETEKAERTAHPERKEKAPSPPGDSDRRRVSRKMKEDALTHLSLEALKKVRLPDPERILSEYPHELSGGMRQRIMIAMAIARNPGLFIADEITTALDVTTQAQILDLLRVLRAEFDSTILIITHDMGVVASTCDRVAIMYAGNIVELADLLEIFANPLHPYTKGLLNAIPNLAHPSETLESIVGSVPDLITPPTGCRFHPRCPYAWDLCAKVKPPHIQTTPGHWVECHLYKEGQKA